LAGCSKESVDRLEEGRAKIAVNALFPCESSAEATTKAVVDGSQPLTLSFVRADELSAGIYGSYGAEFTGRRAAGADFAPLDFTPVQYYQEDGLKTKITGWYPGGAAAAGSGEGFYDVSAGTVSWTIDGDQDILTAYVQEGSSTAQMSHFVFTHRLSQIQFWLYAENSRVAALWGAVQSITVLDQPAQCTLDLPDPATAATAASFTATGSADFTVRNLPAGNLPTTAALFGDPVMIAPRTNTALQASIVMANGKTISVTVPARTYEMGKVTAIKLRFIGTTVEVEPISISDWITGGELNPAVPGIIDGNTFVCLGAFGENDPENYPLHKPWTATPAHGEAAWDANVSGYNTVGEKFRVALSNAKGKDGSSLTMTWFEASGTTDATYNSDGYSACAQYSEETDQSDKGSWRLPTIRELKLIYVYRNSIANSFITGRGYYSATRKSDSNNHAWYDYFSYSSDTVYTCPADDRHYVRCVRDEW
ncbi:MAG: fimbrillin family protein, partial [Alistipes sp.]|uniref:fimbrillin family protein n=1 Tax=Alistipes sp. TaxID=1872444 RepID=UPI001B479AA3